MKLKKGIYNLTFSILGQFITLALGIIIPRLFIITLGSESNGLLSSVNQIFSYMNIMEAGIGLASMQALYSPIAKKNIERINTIMSSTKSYYDKISRYYLIAIVLLALIYPLIVSTNIDKLSVLEVIIFTGLGGWINFKFQGKFKVLLMAEGRTYIITNLTTLTSIITSVGKIVLTVLGYNIVAIQALYFILSLLQMIFYKIYEMRKYKWINYKVKNFEEVVQQKGAAFIHQASNVIFLNTDTILLTLFSNLRIVSVYTIYSMIFSILQNMMVNINQSVQFILGQYYYTDLKKYKTIHRIYETGFFTVLFVIYTIIDIVGIPFIRLYTNGATDATYVDSTILHMFIILQLLYGLKIIGNTDINIAGHFEKTKIQAIIETCINIVVSIILVQKFEIYGVLLGTIIALLYRTNDVIIYTYRHILHSSFLHTYKTIIIYVVVMLAIVNNKNINCDIYINNYYQLAIYTVSRAIIVGVIYFIIMVIFNFKETKQLIVFVKERQRQKCNS